MLKFIASQNISPTQGNYEMPLESCNVTDSHFTQKKFLKEIIQLSIALENIIKIRLTITDCPFNKNNFFHNTMTWLLKENFSSKWELCEDKKLKGGFKLELETEPVSFYSVQTQHSSI